MNQIDKIKQYIARPHLLVCALLIALVSCNDFLEKDPTTQISSPTFWKTQKDADMALAGVYSRLNVSTFNFNGVYSLAIMAGDANEGAASLGTSSTGSFAMGMMEAESGGLLANIYNQCYRGVASCNFFLANIEKVDMPESVRTIYKAEVQFLRGLFYFNLVDFYGGVPLYTTPVTIEEGTIAKSTKEQVYAQVLTDLDFAIANLPNTDYSGRGHAVRGSALTLKSRVMLNMSDWPGAAAAAKQVMDEGKFSLFNNYKTMFLAVGQSNNPEIMFSTKYLNPDNSSDQDIQLIWWGSWNPRAELRDAFECIDGLPIGTSPLYSPSNWKLNRDPRLKENIRAFTDPAIKASGAVVSIAWNTPSQTGLSPVKAGNVESLPIDYSTRSEQDWILIRYAEVLLNFAEATNEVQGPIAAVYEAINEVRARPGVDMPPLPAGLSKEQMRSRIWNERRVEFAFEGMRYRDIRRWKLAETYINTLIEPGTNIRRVFDPSKHYLFPFPLSEMDINPNLVQNPGY